MLLSLLHHYPLHQHSLSFEGVRSIRPRLVWRWLRLHRLDVLIMRRPPVEAGVAVFLGIAVA